MESANDCVSTLISETALIPALAVRVQAVIVQDCHKASRARGTTARNSYLRNSPDPRASRPCASCHCATLPRSIPSTGNDRAQQLSLFKL